MLSLLNGISIKWIAITLAAVVAGVLLFKVYTIIVDNGLKDGIIATQSSTIRTQQNVIQGLNDTIALSNKIINERDQLISEYEKTLDGLDKDLGDDANELAPKSLRELMRRMQ